MMGNGWNWKRFTKFYLHIVFKSRRFVGTWHCNLYHLKYFQVSMGHYLRLNRVSQSIITSEIWPVCERYQNKSIHTLIERLYNGMINAASKEQLAIRKFVFDCVMNDDWYLQHLYSCYICTTPRRTPKNKTVIKICNHWFRDKQLRMTCILIIVSV